MVSRAPARQGGTLRASASFPRDGYLITIGHAGCDPDYAASCNEFIGLQVSALHALCCYM